MGKKHATGGITVGGEAARRSSRPRKLGLQPGDETIDFLLGMVLPVAVTLLELADLGVHLFWDAQAPMMERKAGVVSVEIGDGKLSLKEECKDWKYDKEIFPHV
jgi:hypothetical protein